MNDKKKELSETKELDTKEVKKLKESIVQICGAVVAIMFCAGIAIGILTDYSLDWLSAIMVIIIVVGSVAFLVFVSPWMVSKLIDRKLNTVEIKVYKRV